MISSSLGIARAATRSSALRVSASKLRLLSTLDESHRIHEDFLRDVAKVDPPKRLRSVLKLSSMVGEELCSPRARAGLNPFLIPISKNKEDNSMTCFIRWPTQKKDMDLQIVKTTESGVRLYSLSADHYCHRIAVELDFLGSEQATKAIDLLNSDGELYTAGSYLSLLQSGKFSIGTDSELRLVLDRYLLTKVGAFPDCYERLATNFANNGDATSALITCERSTSVFYSWGHAIHSQTKMMRSLGRHLESKESARASMAAPKWTLGGSKEDLEDAVRCAGFTQTKLLGDMHAFRATDPRETEVSEGGLNPMQVPLDQAAHLMDAVALGNGSWDEARPELSRRYREVGYPDIADFIDTVE